MVKHRSSYLFIVVSLCVVMLSIFWFSLQPDTSSTLAAAQNHHHTWPVFKQNTARTGFNAQEYVLGADLVFSDTITINDADAGQLINLLVTPDFLVVQNQFSIWVLDINTHELVWRYEDCLDSTNFCLVTGNAAVRENDLVFVTQHLLDNESTLRVHDLDTGAEAWTRTIADDLSPVFTITDSGIWLMWQDTGYYLVKLSSFTGNELSSTYNDSFTGAFSRGSMALAGGRIFYAHGNEIIAFSISSHQEEWRYTDTGIVGDLNYDLVALDNALLVAQGERVFALDPANNGAAIWSKSAETCPDGYNPTLNNIVTDGTHVTVNGLCNEDVVTYRLSDGVELWRKTIGPFPGPTAMTGANGAIFIAALPDPVEYYLYLYNLSDGALLQQLPMGIGDTTNVLAVSEGVLYTASIYDQGIQVLERTPADLRVEITEEPQPFCGATVGGVLNYEFKVVNDGPGQADNVEAEIILPDGPHSITPSIGSCTGAVDPVCSLGTLLNGEEVTISVVVTPTVIGTHEVGISIPTENNTPRDQAHDNNRTVKRVTVRDNTGADLMAVDLEVTQGLQTLNNTISMIAGKPTVARAYIRTDGPLVRDVSGVLHGTAWPSGDPLPGSPLLPINELSCITVDGDFPDRTQLDETLLFQLPDEWLVDTIDLQVEINPTGAISDSLPYNNTFAAPVVFEEERPICLRTYRVRTASGPGTGGITFHLSPPSNYLLEDPDGIVTRALSMLPTAEIIVIPESQLLEEWEPSLFTDDDYGPYEFEEDDLDDFKVMSTLWWYETMSDPPPDCVAADAPVHYLGMIHERTKGSDGNFNGQGRIDGNRMIVRLRTGGSGPNNPPSGTTLAHEFGHNFNRRHVLNAASCGPQPDDPWYSPFFYEAIDQSYPYDTCTFDDAALDDPDTHFGFDLLSKTVMDPSQNGDLMSYASSRWPSDYTWNAMANRLQSAPSPSGLRPTAGLLATPDVLLVNGEILTDSVRLDNLLRIPQVDVPAGSLANLLAAGTPTTFTLELLDGSNTVLITKTLSLEASAELENPALWFSTAIPFITDTVTIRVTADGTPVVTETVSPNAPVVAVLTPTAGQLVTDTLTVSWDAGDSDPNTELSFIVQYSHDQGSSWRVVASNVLTYAVTLDSSLLPGSLAQGLVRVIASDGINTGSDQSELFNMAKKDPLIFIQQPGDGAVFQPGETIELYGIGYDPEDGVIPGDDLSWSISGHGSLGSGKKIVLPELGTGTYSITLSTTDSDGQNGTHTVEITITNEKKIYLPMIVR